MFTPPTTSSVLQKAKIAYTLWFQIIEHIPKTHRYTLGGRIEGYFLELLESIFSALFLATERKAARIEIAISKLDGVKFFLQIAWENKCISIKQYGELSEKLDEIGKMLHGWKKGLEKKTPIQTA